MFNKKGKMLKLFLRELLILQLYFLEILWSNEYYYQEFLFSNLLMIPLTFNFALTFIELFFFFIIISIIFLEILLNLF